MASIHQELHCPRSGGGCGGYFIFKLSAGYDRRVAIICPKCKHEHRRNVVNGRIVEQGRFDGETVEKIFPMLSAWSKEPRIAELPRNERDAVVIKDTSDSPIDMAQVILRQSWIERHAGKV